MIKSSSDNNFSDEWLRDKCVLVTGATSGIGRATVFAFARAGARVVFCGLRDAWGAEIENLIGQRGGLGKFIPADVRKPAEMTNLVAEAEATFGPLVVAVNSAGVSHAPYRLADLPTDIFSEVVATNLHGVFYAMQAQLRIMSMRRAGCIINLASRLTACPSSWMAAYSASKAGVVSLTQTAAQDYQDRGVRIYALSPHAVATPMFDQALRDIDGDSSKYAGGLPKDGKVTAPESIAQQILVLAHPENTLASGSNVIVA